MKVLVVDDSTLFRKVMTEVLAALPNIEVVGQAQNGKLALQKVRELRPDLVTLDMEMPEMDGLAVLDALKSEVNPPSVIVVSALTQRGGHLTIQALQKGAFDFVTKPDAVGPAQSKELLRAELAPRLKALELKISIRSILARPPTPPVQSAVNVAKKVSSLTTASLHSPVVGVTAAPDDISKRMNRIMSSSKPELVLIGVSTGGPSALAALLPNLPEKLGLPVLIVQHMPPIFTKSLADSLNGKCKLRICEAMDGDIIKPDCVYIAPGGHQMRIVPGPNGAKVVQITEDPPENNCRPAVDYLFRSVAKHFPVQTLGIILTGMGSDGTVGLKLLKRNGCFIIAQDEASCVVYGMPKAAVDAGIVDSILPLEAIAPAVINMVRNHHP